MAPPSSAVLSQTAADGSAQDPPRPNRKQREAQARRALLAQLQERWPQVFPWDFQQRKPLALGIHEQIAPHFPGTPVWRIKQAIALFQYGGGGAYLRALRKGGPRYTLEGIPNGEVTSTEQEQAQRDLEAVLARRRAQRHTRPRAEGARNGTAPQPRVSPEPCTAGRGTLPADD